MLVVLNRHGVRNTLGKKERLKSQKSIAALFREGQSVFQYPFKVIYRVSDGSVNHTFPLKFAISIPSKKFRKAVIRNRLKRLCREAYRLNNKELQALAVNNVFKIEMIFIYIADEEMKFHDIGKGMAKVLEKISKQVAFI